jgi:predicted phage terminase large subunit-like protein
VTDAVDRLLAGALGALERHETAARLHESVRDQFPTPGALAHYLDPRRVSTPMLDLLDTELRAVAAGDTQRLAWSCPPQEGKSQAISRAFPLWMLLRDPDTRVGIASYEHGIARRWGRQIRNDIQAHPELGLSISADSSAAHEWQLSGHQGGVYCVGIGGPLTGRPLDLLIVDDPVKGRAEADSQTYRDAARDWWQQTAVTRLSPGAAAIVLMTRWHEDDLLGWLVENEPDAWWYVNVPAEAERDDPLGRDVGQWLVSARGRSAEDWQDIRRRVGSRGWAALYQGRPSPVEGGIIKRAWWVYYTSARAVQRPDGAWHVPGANEVLQSWDLTFKDTSASDYVVGQVWARSGSKAWLLDEVRARADFPTTCRLIRETTFKWPQATRKLIEDKANGPAVIAQLRTEIGGIVAVNPKDSKEARVHAVTPFIEAGDIEIPDPSIAPWIGAFVEECSAFPNGAHDDRVDTMSQALHQMLLGARPRYRSFPV